MSGPWHIEIDDSQCLTIVADNGEVIATVHPSVEIMARARLLASAPLLRVALLECSNTERDETIKSEIAEYALSMSGVP